jgi:glycosyltransferase involved in cell wall biosynthesis
VAFMPRKNEDDIVQVINLLKFRNHGSPVLDGFGLVAIDGESEESVARIFRNCQFFLSFGYPEGCALPPLEAMSCGCVVIGYHGWVLKPANDFIDTFCCPDNL